MKEPQYILSLVKYTGYNYFTLLLKDNYIIIIINITSS
jgi:hypothetical protein